MSSTTLPSTCSLANCLSALCRGTVVTLECVEKLIKKDMMDPVSGDKLSDRDIIPMQRVRRGGGGHWRCSVLYSASDSLFTVAGLLLQHELLMSPGVPPFVLTGRNRLFCVWSRPPRQRSASSDASVRRRTAFAHLPRPAPRCPLLYCFCCLLASRCKVAFLLNYIHRARDFPPQLTLSPFL